MAKQRKQITLKTQAKTWTARTYQQRAIDALNSGKRRLFLAWHRRAGKDAVALHMIADQARLVPGNYWHMLPTYAQAKKVIWTALDGDGRRMVEEVFPDAVAVNNQSMMITLENGSTIQLIGSDNYNTLVGAGVRGVVFSEWALCDPQAWSFFRPMLAENKGFAIFITTFRGHNHAYQMYRRVRKLDDWYCDLQTIADTKRNDGSPVISEETVKQELIEGMRPSLVRQEYYCDPETTAQGGVYSKSVQEMRNFKQIARWSHVASDPVIASIELRYLPLCVSVVFMQMLGGDIVVIGSASYPFATLDECIANIRTEFPWRAHVYVTRNDPAMIDMLVSHGVMAEYGHTVNDSARHALTSAMLARTYIDNHVRAYSDNDDNNKMLIESLANYRYRQSLLTNADDNEFSNHILDSWEKYLVGCIESFAEWERSTVGGLSAISRAWGRDPNYKLNDRAII
jgi:hypothetical protein